MRRIPGANIAPLPFIERNPQEGVVGDIVFEAQAIVLDGIALAKKTYHTGTSIAFHLSPFIPFPRANSNVGSTKASW